MNSFPLSMSNLLTNSCLSLKNHKLNFLNSSILYPCDFNLSMRPFVLILDEVTFEHILAYLPCVLLVLWMQFVRALLPFGLGSARALRTRALHPSDLMRERWIMIQRLRVITFFTVQRRSFSSISTHSAESSSLSFDV